jgi:hypothetical protein
MRSATKRDIPWLLSEGDFESFWQQNCSYCGSEIETIGIDRIDNDGPYVLDNCKPCCSTCNKMKLDLSEEKFIEMIINIKNNLKL